MKKLFFALTALAAVFVFTACGNNLVQSSEKASESTKNSPAILADADSSKKLVVYFSMPETDKPDNMTKEEANSTVVANGKVLGNTQYVAEIIQSQTGSDIFRIEPQTPYPLNHRVLVELAADEKDSDYRPVIKGQIQNISEYDTIFIGYPNWWGDMPMIMYTFLEAYDLSGKTVIPFNTHGGSGFSDTINSIQKLQSNAKVSKNGFTVSRNSVQNAENDIVDWLQKLGYAKK